MATMGIDKQTAVATMERCGFSYQQRIEWWVWAARSVTCPNCESEPYEACYNLTQLRRGIQIRTRWPHEPRVDWAKLIEGLRSRGYIEERKQ